MDNEFWYNFTALLPSGYDTVFDKNECTVKADGKEVNIVRNDASFTVNGKTLHFEDKMEDVINTMLVPYVLQELDGEKRIWRLQISNVN